MEPIEYDVVEFFLQGGVGWVVVAPNFGTCFRQKKSQVWRRYPPFRNFILTKKIKVVTSMAPKLWLIVCSMVLANYGY